MGAPPTFLTKYVPDIAHRLVKKMGDDLEPYLLVTSTEVMHLGYAGEDAPQHTVGCTATLLNRLDETYEGDQLFDPLTFDPQHIKNLWQEGNSTEFFYKFTS